MPAHQWCGAPVVPEGAGQPEVHVSCGRCGTGRGTRTVTPRRTVAAQDICKYVYRIRHDLGSYTTVSLSWHVLKPWMKPRSKNVEVLEREMTKEFAAIARTVRLSRPTSRVRSYARLRAASLEPAATAAAPVHAHERRIRSPAPWFSVSASVCPVVRTHRLALSLMLVCRTPRAGPSAGPGGRREFSLLSSSPSNQPWQRSRPRQTCPSPWQFL